MQSGREDTLEKQYAIKFSFKLEKMPQKRIECFRLLLKHLAWIEHQLLSGIRDSRKAGSLWGMMRGVGGVRKSIHQSLLAKGLGLGLLCWGFKDYSTKMGIKTVPHPPKVETFLPVTFGYALTSEAVVMRQQRIGKRLWWR